MTGPDPAPGHHRPDPHDNDVHHDVHENVHENDQPDHHRTGAADAAPRRPREASRP